MCKPLSAAVSTTNTLQVYHNTELSATGHVPVFVVTAGDTDVVVQTQQPPTHSGETNIYVNRVRGTLWVDRTAFMMARARMFSFSSGENQVVLSDVGSMYVVGIYGKVAGNYLFSAYPPQYTMIRMGRTDSVELHDGVVNFFSWRVDTDFPSIGVSYRSAPLYLGVAEPASCDCVMRTGRTWMYVTVAAPLKMLAFS